MAFTLACTRSRSSASSRGCSAQKVANAQVNSPSELRSGRRGLLLHARLPRFLVQEVSTTAVSKPSSSSCLSAQRTISRTSSTGSPMKASWIGARSHSSRAAACLQKSSSATMVLVEGGEGRVILASSISISLWAAPRAGSSRAGAFSCLLK